MNWITRNRLFAALWVCALALVLSACAANGEEGAADGGKLKVTTTIGMITDVVKEVGGEHVEVTGLMGEGTDPHLFKATQGDIRRLEDADLIFYNGLHLEAQLGEVLEKMSEDRPVIAVSKDVDRSMLHAGDPALDEEYDPHIWFDVSLWMQAVETVTAALAEQDPDHAEAYRSNADAYLAEMEELHQYARDQIALIPEQQRVLITAHDAFGYFGSAYGIRVMGLQGMSTASEAGVKDVTQLRDFIIENNIKAIFVESSVSEENIKAVIEGAKSKGHEVKIGGTLYSDAMGPADTPEGTYLGMVRHNVDTIVTALK